MSYPKIVDDAHYHIWTDALHGRALSHQANNEWDRGTYVRWTVTSAWTALETGCEGALGVPGIGRRFKEYLDDAVAQRNLPPLQWGEGVWQRVTTLQGLRKGFVHLSVDQAELFPGADVADDAIDIVRSATTELHGHAGSAPAAWLQDDYDRGWHKRPRAEASMTVIPAGIDRDDPLTIRIGYVKDGTEYVHTLPASGELGCRRRGGVVRPRLPPTGTSEWDLRLSGR
jgi:hypothetical protein